MPKIKYNMQKITGVLSPKLTCLIKFEIVLKIETHGLKCTDSITCSHLSPGRLNN